MANSLPGPSSNFPFIFPRVSALISASSFIIDCSEVTLVSSLDIPLEVGAVLINRDEAIEIKGLIIYLEFKTCESVDGFEQHNLSPVTNLVAENMI